MKVTRSTKEFIEVPNVFKRIPTRPLSRILGVSDGHASRIRSEQVTLSIETYERYKKILDKVSQT